jgi:hypothetical protein
MGADCEALTTIAECNPDYILAPRAFILVIVCDITRF